MGYCICDKHSVKHFIQHVSFKCSDLKHGNEYKKFSASNLSQAIAIAATALKEDGTFSEEQKGRFLTNILLSVHKEWKFE